MSSLKAPYTKVQVNEWENFFQLNNMNYATRVKVVGGRKGTFTFSFFQNELGYFHIGSREKWNSKITDKFKAQTFAMTNSLESLICLESPTILKAISFAEEGLREYPTDYCYSLLEDEAVDINLSISTKGMNYLDTLFMVSKEQIEKLKGLSNATQQEIYLSILKESFNKGYVDFERVKALHKTIVPYKLRNHLNMIEELGCIDYNKDLDRVIIQEDGLKMYTELESYKMIEEG